MIASAGVGEEAVSIAIKGVARVDWTTSVYKRDIQGEANTPYKQPGYDAF